MKVRTKRITEQKSHGVIQKYTTSTTEREVHLFLQHHLSDMHFMGTLLHELGHCFVHTFENGGHTEEWLQTTNKLMQIINHFIGDFGWLFWVLTAL